MVITEELKTMSNTEINELCAIKVMEWEKKRNGPFGTYYFKEDGSEVSHINQWNPAEDMNDAWTLFEKLREKFPWVGIDTFAKGYRCLVIDDEKDTMDGIADTAPLAICKAALLALIDS